MDSEVRGFGYWQGEEIFLVHRAFTCRSAGKSEICLIQLEAGTIKHNLPSLGVKSQRLIKSRPLYTNKVTY